MSLTVTKYEQAYLSIAKDGQRVLIDPSTYTSDLGDISNVVAIVYTHMHADHFSEDHLQTIVSQNPQVKVFAPEDMLDQLGAVDPVAPVHESVISTGGFDLKFFVGSHAHIHPDHATCQNLGVIVDGSLYYPGDSLEFRPVSDIKTLAVPLSGPWLQMGEVMDFVAAIKPEMCLVTHDALLSDKGVASHTGWLSKTDIPFTRLNIGDSVTI